MLRLAVMHELMTDDEVQRWFLYRDNRNNTAHDYGEQFASQTLILIPDFLRHIAALADVLQAKLGKENAVQ